MLVVSKFEISTKKDRFKHFLLLFCFAFLQIKLHIIVATLSLITKNRAVTPFN